MDFLKKYIHRVWYLSNQNRSTSVYQQLADSSFLAVLDASIIWCGNPFISCSSAATQRPSAAIKGTRRTHICARQSHITEMPLMSRWLPLNKWRRRDFFRPRMRFCGTISAATHINRHQSRTEQSMLKSHGPIVPSPSPRFYLFKTKKKGDCNAKSAYT